MKCVDVEKYLSSFDNDEPDFNVRQKIENHLQTCHSCRKSVEIQQTANHLLKNLPAIAPSNQFDARMMQAFRTHGEKKNKAGFWATVFGNFSISKSAAFGLVALIIVAGAAFQLGRMTSPNVETAETQKTNSSSLLTANSPKMEIIEKPIEVPVTKIVEVPVYKEKIVNRIIYKDREIIKTIKLSDKNETRDANSSFQNTAVNSIQSSETSMPINLKNFQPVSEIKIHIIKKGEENEK